MNAILNETQLWYCDICVMKQLKLKVNQNINNSKTHKHKQQYGTVVKEYEFIKPDIDEVNYILNDTITDRRNKLFHSLEYRCFFDIKFTNMGNNEENILSITLGYMKYISQFYGLNKKSQACKKYWFYI